MSITQDDGGADDWETDPDFVVRVSSPPWLCFSRERLSSAVALSRVDLLIVSSSFQNDVSEKEQRWGAKTVKGSGHQEHIK